MNESLNFNYIIGSNELSKIKSHEMVPEFEYLCVKIEVPKAGHTMIANAPIENYVNNSRASIKQINNALERTLNIDLREFYYISECSDSEVWKK